MDPGRVGPSCWLRRHLARVGCPAAGAAATRPEAAVRRPRCLLGSVSAARAASPLSRKGGQSRGLGSAWEGPGGGGPGASSEPWRGERVPRCGNRAGPRREPRSGGRPEGARGLPPRRWGRAAAVVAAGLCGTASSAWSRGSARCREPWESPSDSWFTRNSNKPCAGRALSDTP